MKNGKIRKKNKFFMHFFVSLESRCIKVKKQEILFFIVNNLV